MVCLPLKAAKSHSRTPSSTQLPGMHLWRANPPLLLNHLTQHKHWTVPLTGPSLSFKHLCPCVSSYLHTYICICIVANCPNLVRALMISRVPPDRQNCPDTREAIGERTILFAYSTKNDSSMHHTPKLHPPESSCFAISLALGQL